MKTEGRLSEKPLFNSRGEVMVIQRSSHRLAPILIHIRIAFRGKPVADPLHQTGRILLPEPRHCRAGVCRIYWIVDDSGRAFAGPVKAIHLAAEPVNPPHNAFQSRPVSPAPVARVPHHRRRASRRCERRSCGRRTQFDRRRDGSRPWICNPAGRRWSRL